MMTPKLFNVRFIISQAKLRYLVLITRQLILRQQRPPILHQQEVFKAS